MDETFDLTLLLRVTTPEVRVEDGVASEEDEVEEEDEAEDEEGSVVTEEVEEEDEGEDEEASLTEVRLFFPSSFLCLLPFLSSRSILGVG